MVAFLSFMNHFIDPFMENISWKYQRQRLG